MAWGGILHPSSTPLRAPDDGIVSSQRPKGPLATAWNNNLKDIQEESSGARLARGRRLARSGRVRDLWFIQGRARAEVVDSAENQPTIRVARWTQKQWAQVIDVLRRRLDHVAALLQGDLPPALTAAIEREGLNLIPTRVELKEDCTCADYMMPCAHVAAVHMVLAEALDGDPFLLLTLRGRTRDQILNELRATWGDREPLLDTGIMSEEPAPSDGDWTRATGGLPDLRFNFKVESENQAVGLRALGPAPDNADLVHTLGPLYKAGAQASFKMAHIDPHPTTGKLKRQRAAQPPADHPDYQLTACIVDELVDENGMAASRISDKTQRAGLLVRAELLELEKLGIVYRSGRTRATRWWLG